MEGEGFIAYDMEWWHFTYSQSGESELYYDFVIREPKYSVGIKRF